MGLGLNASRRWRAAYASAIGTAHQRLGTPCQDAARCVVLQAADGTEVLIAAVSDGAGSASRSDIGAALAVEAFLAAFGEAAAEDTTLNRIDRAFVTAWIAAVQAKIGARAAADGHAMRDYACTLLGAVVTGTAAAYVLIGDGTIIVGTEEPEAYAWVAWPQHGEYANVTQFVTEEDAPRVVHFSTGPAVDEIALFTDGIERLVLDHAKQTVHAPAFLPIFRWLRGCEAGSPEGMSEPLAAYLGSDHVNRRTDDDKTLVVATRRPVSWPEADDADARGL